MDAINQMINDERLPTTAYDRFAISSFDVAMKWAEAMLVIGAFRFVALKSGSAAMSVIAFAITLLFSMYLGVVMVHFLARVTHYTRLPPKLRMVLAAVWVVLGAGSGLAVLEVARIIASTQS